MTLRICARGKYLGAATLYFSILLYYRDVGAFSKVGPRLLQLRFGVSAPQKTSKILKNHKKSPKSVQPKTSKFQQRLDLDEAVSEFS